MHTDELIKDLAQELENVKIIQSKMKIKKKSKTEKHKTESPI
jgi:hypothetical protein